MKKAFLVFGPPGAGKGTQANLLAAKFNLIHFDTGKYIERVVQDPANRADPEIDKYRMDFDNGKLIDPKWVFKIVSAQTKKIAESGFGLVFSGSPRTYDEAFELGNDRRGFMGVLEDVFGKDNITPILLRVAAETSIKRNSNRLICSVCGVAVMFHEHSRPEFCPICGGLFRRRTLDIPETIKIRLVEYETRTAPILEGLKKNGYKIIEIDGEPLPYEVFNEIIKSLE